MKKALVGLLFIIFTTALFSQAPDWQWATQAGGSGVDFGQRIAIDANANSYVTGSFNGTATFGSYSLTSSGLIDIFLAKMDADGNWLWATQAGGSGDDYGQEIVIDDNANSYITGFFSNTVTFGSYSLTSSGASDIFIAKMDADGNWLWATQAGGSGVDHGQGIAIDDYGNSYVSGDFYETVTFGSHSLTSSGGSDIFVAKMDSNGNWLWATQAGGSNYESCHAIAIDDNGYSYVSGDFYETVTFGSHSLTSSGGSDIFVAKMDSNGNWLWATQAGGVDYDGGSGIAIDDNANSYVTGSFSDTVNFGTHSLISSGEYDIFVAKMDAVGNWLWATQAGGSQYDMCKAIAIDDYGNSYVTGYFYESATFGSHALISIGEYDIFVAKMDANGNWLWVTQAGGSGSDFGWGIALDDNGNSYVIGYFSETAIFDSYSMTSSGEVDIFVAKLFYNTAVDYELANTMSDILNYPNPFNPTTSINFSIQNDSKINLSIYNIKGQMIKSLLNDQITSGEHSIVWNGDDDYNKPVSSGIYFYKLNVNDKTEAMKKCLLLK